MTDILIGAIIAAALVIAVVLIVVIAARHTPRDWRPSRLDEAQHGPVSFHEQVLLDAIERGDLHEGHYESGSEQ